MSSDEDDYLSSKFLVETPAESSKSSKSYSQIRKDAQKRSQLRQEQNRVKGRREREVESREEGLSKSLFERAKEEEEAGLAGGSSKALSMMMKMGFKPGQALGANKDPDSAPRAESACPEPPPQHEKSTSPDRVLKYPSADAPESEGKGGTAPTPKIRAHITEPIPLQEWQGKRGIGLGLKRARSPDAVERMAKMAKMAEQAEHRDFRERARDDYNNRRAEGRLGPAQRTCTTLDEEMGKEFNVLWLNPTNENTFPPGLIDALAMQGNVVIPGANRQRLGQSTSISSTVTGANDQKRERLRAQMQAEALAPLTRTDDELAEIEEKSINEVSAMDQYTPEMLAEAASFLQLQAQDRLRLVLSYLRSRHNYCFWCGVRYENGEDLNSQCPGSEEDDHD